MDTVITAPEVTRPADKVPGSFIRADHMAFAGTHLILDLWGASRIDDPTLMEQALREGAEACGATLLSVDVHHFDVHPELDDPTVESGGVTGVAVLAESHISVHTWPEHGYAAFDVFVCGKADPRKVIPVLKAYFTPASIQVVEHRRGLMFAA